MSASVIQLTPYANPAIPETMVTVSIARDGDILKSKCPQSRPTAGIEHLIHTAIGGFRIHAIERHTLNGPESFRSFSDVLKGDALLKWQQLMAGHYAIAARRTPAGFIRAQKALIVKMEEAQLGNILLRLMTKEGDEMKTGTTHATSTQRSGERKRGGNHRRNNKRNGSRQRRSNSDDSYASAESNSNNSHDSADSVDPDRKHSSKRTRRGTRDGQNNKQNKSSRPNDG